MSDIPSPIRIATRGSALALVQANTVLALCRQAFPGLTFELNIIKTTGDKLQTASMSKPAPDLPKGLFTKELEVALLAGEADLAVHSLKDLPTELPAGLMLGAVLPRVDPRDALILRGDAIPVGRRYAPGTTLRQLPQGAVVATSSTRRSAQLLHLRPDVRVVEIRGNVPTRLQKLVDHPDWDATLLAVAGLLRLGYEIAPGGQLHGAGIPAGLVATPVGIEDMVPCVGQAAIGLEIRSGDAAMEAVCARLNHDDTLRCVRAERAFLRAMGGGCQSPIAAYALSRGEQLELRAVSFKDPEPRRAEASGPGADPERLGEAVAERLH
jgi:hydroxymethylbilane synthase